MCSYTKLKEAVEQRLPMPTAVQVTGIGNYPQDDELLIAYLFVTKHLANIFLQQKLLKGLI